MSQVQSAAASFRDRHGFWRSQHLAASGKIFLLYALLLGGVAFHLYRSPIYDMDSIQYMGNALLMEDTDVVRVHHRVYAELQQSVPKGVRDDLLGRELGAPADQNKSRQERAANPLRFAEFLPLFAIRPLYNQTLWLVSKTGLGLVRSGILISVVSYFALGLLLFLWVRKYAAHTVALAIPTLLMLSPPLTMLGRDPTSDALATLVAFGSLYLLFQKERPAAGLALALVSIYFRTDFVVLAGLVILACWLERRVDFWKAFVLAAVALGSVFFINHFAGDYGFKMLYYRNFVAVPVAPGEMTVQFSFRDYVAALRSGVTQIMNSFFLPFLIVGVLGLASKRTRMLFAVSLAYLLLHFLILPNWQERWFGVFYLSMGVCAAASLYPEREPAE